MNTNTLSLVTRQQAEALKEIGFDWPVTDAVVFGKNTTVEYVECNCQGPKAFNYNQFENHVSVPSLALAAMWCRDVHGIYVLVGIDGLSWYCSLILNIGGDTLNRLTACWADSHDSALSAGLDEAVKIIKERRNK